MKQPDLREYVPECPEEETVDQIPNTPQGRLDCMKQLLDKADSEDGKELTEEEINEKQKAAIKEAQERINNGEALTDKELGNLGEMMMDQYYISKGYKPLHKNRVTSLDDPGHKGIDGVYEKNGQYIIVDAKFNSAQLHDTKDGRQMSEKWINERLDAAVGKEKADEMRDAYEDDPSSVSKEVYNPKPDEDGKTYCYVYHVDEAGNKCDDAVNVEIYQNGEPLPKKND